MDEKTLKDQLSFSPRLENKPLETPAYDNIIVGGMGGSALPARMLFFLDPVFPLWLHDDYGLPGKSEGKTLYIAISYSGETGETLSFAKEAMDKNYPLAVISSGGALLEMARGNNLPHIIVPSGLVPRNAVLYMLRALLSVTGHENLMKELENSSVDFDALSREGESLGSDFREEIPLIYSSRKNRSLAHIWKIMLNETGKTPAFENVFPELTHNEMESINSEFRTLLLMDREDDERVRHSMETFIIEAGERGIKTKSLELPSGGANKLISTLVMSRAAAGALAKERGVSSEATPFIEAFKKSL